MDSTDFRAAITAEVVAWAAANYPSMDVCYENGPTPDQDAISSPWLDMELRWFDTTQLTVSEGAGSREHGVISLAVYARAGTGTAQTEAVIRSLTQAFKLRRVGTAILRAPRRYTPTTVAGWYKVGIMVPFTLDS